jgi:hypothetical protein
MTTTTNMRAALVALLKLQATLDVTTKTLATAKAAYERAQTALATTTTDQPKKD